MSAAGGRRRVRLLGAAASALLLASPGARAQEPPRAPGEAVRLRIDGCVPVRSADVERLARLELAHADADLGLRAPIEVDAGCAADDIVIASRAGAAGRVRAVERRIARATLAEGAADRLLALVVVETALSSVDRAPDRAPPEVAAAGARGAPARATSLAIVGALRTFPQTGLVAMGGALSANRRLGAALLVGVDLALATGARRLPVGTARALDLSGAVRVAAEIARGPSRLRAGAGWHVGWTRLSADPADAGIRASSAQHEWTGPSLHGAYELALGDRAFVVAAAEAGRPLRAVIARANGANVLEWGGVWITAAFGGGVRF
jgi:hypothetical protein